MNRTRHLRAVSRHTPVRAATAVSGVTPRFSAQASTIRVRSASDCDAVRLRTSASSASRSLSVSTSGTSFGLGIRQAYYLPRYFRRRTLVVGRDDVTVEVTLRGISTPLAVTEWRRLPPEVRRALPTAEDLTETVTRTVREIESAT
jgi:hypothetical protein